jgi:hypothetical protein
MVWFFERPGASLRIETRVDSLTGEYVLQVERPGQPTTIERFKDPQAFERRVLSIEQQLTAERWTQVGGPEILPHGWRGDFTH